ncbi:L-serine ammonia-lyase, iron-sulfur-dependent subunit beta [Deinococcus lacus]|uniref:L-serine dehydratase n=1 Tax=Deinococcus lacus TaxID=392561 RepID=A0ABW1YA31_9DEIO
MSLLDMVGPVMIGPSSSHTAGACRLGLVGHFLLGEPVREANIGLHASFAKTGKGHGTHFALIAGLLGYLPHDARLPRSFADAQAAGMHFEFHDVELGQVHPNSARLRLRGDSATAEVIGSSTGGGVIEVTEIDGFAVRLSAASPTLLLRYEDTVGVIARVTALLAGEQINIATLLCTRKKRGGDALLVIELDALPSAEALAWLRNWREMQWVRLLPKLMDG